jgi:hypothetical protein
VKFSKQSVLLKALSSESINKIMSQEATKTRRERYFAEVMVVTCPMFVLQCE